MARKVAADVAAALGVETELTVYRGAEERREVRRRLAEKALPRAWDVLVLEHRPQAADAPPLELHRAVVGATGEYRAGPTVPEFEALYATLQRQTSRLGLAYVSHCIDQFVCNEALALFLCAPQALYAVNRHVRFTGYRTTFELAPTRVGGGHWSRRGINQGAGITRAFAIKPAGDPGRGTSEPPILN